MELSVHRYSYHHRVRCFFKKNCLETHEVRIKSLADFSYLKPSVLTDYYKNHLSDFLSWDQLSHAEDYILFPENMGPDLCIDETVLSNGELVTNVINKSGHGKRGTLVAIIKGAKSEDIVKCLKKIPQEQRDQVENITLDMATVCIP